MFLGVFARRLWRDFGYGLSLWLGFDGFRFLTSLTQQNDADAAVLGILGVFTDQGIARSRQTDNARDALVRNTAKLKFGTADVARSVESDQLSLREPTTKGLLSVWPEMEIWLVRRERTAPINATDLTFS